MRFRFHSFVLLLFCVLIVFSFRAHARVVISEVMHDPPDQGHAWLEIVNDGFSSFPVTDLSLFSEGIPHTIQIFSGSSLLLPGDVAVIVEDSESFFASYPDHLGSVFVSDVFLPRDGGILDLSDSRGSISSLSYFSDERSAGTGGSLHILRDGRQVAGAATPGVIAVNPIIPPDPSRSSASVVAQASDLLSAGRPSTPPASDPVPISRAPSSGEVCPACTDCITGSSPVFFWIAIVLSIIAFEFFVLLLFLFFRFRSSLFF